MSNNLLAATARLADVLTRENDALKRLDYSAAAALLPAKEAALTQFGKQPNLHLLPAAPELVALGRRLGLLAIENQTLLGRAIAVQTRVVRIVARACAEPRVSADYGGNGARAPSNHAAAMALSTRA